MRLSGLRQRATLATIGTVAFFALVVLPRAALPMVDGDAWWHIHAGEEILDRGRVATANTWTIAGDGFPWTSQDWLSNVLMATLFNAGAWGVAWLSLAFASLVAVAFAMLWSAIGGGDPTIGWLSRFLWLTVGVIVAGPIIGIRVQTIDLLMAALVVSTLWRYLAFPTPGRALLLVPLALAWVNLHAGWLMLFLLGGAVVVGETVERLAPRSVRKASLSWPAIAWLVGALFGAAASLVVNPNGFAIYGYPFATATIEAHRDFLVEWSPPNLASFEGQVAVACLLFVVTPTLILGRRTLRLADILWLLGLSIMTLSAVRFALFLGPIAAAMGAVHISPILSGSRLGQALSGALRRSREQPRNAARASFHLSLLAAVAVIGVAVAVSRASPPSQAVSIAESVPLTAAAWVERERPAARIFNSYSWGGYLSRRLPHAKVYIDGRSDIYGNELIQEYAATLNASSNPGTLLERDRIDVAVLANAAPLNAWMQASGVWERQYRDEMASVWVRTDTP